MTKTASRRTKGRSVRIGPLEFGLTEESIFDGVYHQRSSENSRYQPFLAPNQSDEDKYRALKRYLTEMKGLEIIEVPTEREVPEGYSAARYGNTVWIADCYGGRRLSPIEKIVRLAHEHGAGFDHENTDEEAQRYAIDLLTHEFPHEEARILAERDLQEWLRGWYSLN